MGKGDNIVGKIYLREHSTLFRKRSPPNRDGDYSFLEDPIVEITGLARIIVTILCRNKQRLLQQAWNRWAKNVVPPIEHDYTSDLKIILMRSLAFDQYRTELEIEVLYKWAHQHADKDPTGVASILCFCKRKKAVVQALQTCRLERITPGDSVIFQGQIPLKEDGHFTVISGTFEALQFPDNSIRILNVHEAVKLRQWSRVNNIMKEALVLSEISYPSGFGELATLTNTQRTASIRCSMKMKYGPDAASDTSLETLQKEEFFGELLVVPKQSILECLECRREGSGLSSKISEAIDFLRQSGLAQRIGSADLITAAKAMKRRTLMRGEVIYCKGEPVESIFLVVSGDFVLDTLDDVNSEGFQPFKNVNYDYCFHLSSGSILGDEGATGANALFASTAMVISDLAVVFEATGFACEFLFERLGLLRYSALMYSNRPRYSMPLKAAENVNVYSNFNSLRKCIASARPFRETVMKVEERLDLGKDKEDELAHSVLNKKGRGKVKETKISDAELFGDNNSPEHEEKKRSSGHKIGGGKRTYGSSSLGALGGGLGTGLDDDADSHIEKGMRHYFDKAFHCHRRVVVSRVALHHAEEALKESRKKANIALKRFTQESILFNEITKGFNLDATEGAANHMDSAKANELRLAEKKMKSLIAQYRERAALKRLAEDKDKVSLQASGSAVQLFETFIEGTDAAQDEIAPVENELSVESVLNEFELKNVKHLSRIVKYFAALDKNGTDILSSQSSLAGSSMSDMNSEILSEMKVDESIQKQGEKMLEKSSNIENKNDVNVPPLDLSKSAPSTAKGGTRGSTADSKAISGGSSRQQEKSAEHRKLNKKSATALKSNGINGEKSSAVVDDKFGVKTKNESAIITKDPKMYRYDPPPSRRVIPFKKTEMSSFDLTKDNEPDSQVSKNPSVIFQKVLDAEIEKLSDAKHFFDVLNSNSFELRRRKKHAYLWNTRFMKTSSNSIESDKTINEIKVTPKAVKKAVQERSKVGLVDSERAQEEKVEDTASNITEDISRVDSDHLETNEAVDSESDSDAEGDADAGVGELCASAIDGDNSVESLSSSYSKEPIVSAGSMPNLISHAAHTERDVSSPSNSHLGERELGVVEPSGASRPTSTPAPPINQSGATSSGADKSKRTISSYNANLMVEVGTLASTNPISNALSNFQEAMYSDYKKRSLLEGRKMANKMSRFELPKIVPTPSAEAAAELEMIKSKGSAIYDTTSNSTVNSQGIDKASLLLLSCLRGNNKKSESEEEKSSDKAKDISTLISPSKHLKNYLVKTVKTADSLDNLKLKKKYDNMIYESLVYTTEMKGKIMKRKEDNPSNKHNNTDIDAINNIIKSASISSDANAQANSDNKPKIDGSGPASIENWQQFTVKSSVESKKGPKIAFPVVYINTTSVPGVTPVDDKIIVDPAGGGNKSRRFGGSNLLQLSKGEADEQRISGPSSYIDLYKNRLVSKTTGH